MGRKLALLVGINYRGTANELGGCINDVRSMEEFLTGYGYQCRIMVDDGSVEKRMYPERGNILNQMRQLSADSKPGDKLFFHYSGHGTYTYDYNGDEDDKRDEAICPLMGGVITDDEIRRVLVDNLGQKVSLMMLMDCCHSGTGADLRYNYEDVSLCSAKKGRRYPDEYVPSQWTHKHLRRENKRCKESISPVICISGCRDSQTSADTVFDGKACGAMTAAFLRAWKVHKVRGNMANVLDVLQYMTGMLKCYRYGQVPQLSMSMRQSDVLLAKNDCNIVL